jgi:pimeloyl-ACP methyl ester carboxylesterase
VLSGGDSGGVKSAGRPCDHESGRCQIYFGAPLVLDPLLQVWSSGTARREAAGACPLRSDHAMDQMRAAGCTLAVVATGGDPGHAPARALYEAAGFTGLPLVRYYRGLVARDRPGQDGDGRGPIGVGRHGHGRKERWMAFAEVGGASLAYDEAGSGQAVVLCHAGIADRRMWTGPFEELAATCRAIRFDWRGYGESSPAAGDHTLDADLLSLLDALEIDRAVLAGCSVGGAAALDVAAAAPDRVAGLVLTGPGLSGYPWPAGFADPLQDRIAAKIPDARRRAYRDGTSPTVLDADVEAVADAHARFWVAGPGRDPAAVDPHVWDTAMTMLRQIFRREWTEHSVEPGPPQRAASACLSEIEVPTVVVNGLDDVPALQEIADLLTAGIPGVRRIDLPDTGHLAPLERPRQVAAAITDLVRRVAP